MRVRPQLLNQRQVPVQKLEGFQRRAHLQAAPHGTAEKLNAIEAKAMPQPTIQPAPTSAYPTKRKGGHNEFDRTAKKQ
jgi:hypothetical protein